MVQMKCSKISSDLFLQKVEIFSYKYTDIQLEISVHTFPEAFSNAATISKTDVPFPVPRL